MNPIRFALALTASLGIVACSGERPNETPSPSSTQPPAKLVPGYRHLLSSSVFHLGTSQSQMRVGIFDKVVGSEGVFATNYANGAIFANPTANSAAEKAPPLTTDKETHNREVRTYFTSMGLPADQIDHVDVGSSIVSSGRVGEREAAPRFIGYTSTLVRRVDGYPVIESVASARLNAEHEVVREHVYWPELPASVVADAKSLDALAHDPVAGPRFLAGLPEQGKNGRVVIHHSPSMDTSSFVAKAAFDVNVGRSVHHFGADGSEFRLPH